MAWCARRWQKLKSLLWSAVPAPVPLIKMMGRRHRSSWTLSVIPLGHSCCSQDKSHPRRGPAFTPLPGLPRLWRNLGPRPAGPECSGLAGRELLVLSVPPAQRAQPILLGPSPKGGRGGTLGPTVCPRSGFVPWDLTERLFHCGDNHRLTATRRGRLSPSSRLQELTFGPLSTCLSV